jgi:3-hydroxybutyryl-CoA dehydrogenase
MGLTVIAAGASRSFPNGTDALPTDRRGTLVIGADAARGYRDEVGDAHCDFVAVELGSECLAIHTGLDASDAHRRTVGFARFRLGDAAPTQLVEVVRQPWTDEDAVAAARAFFEAAGFRTALCEDIPGRIVDRLIRPYFNAVLRRLDQKLASAADMDATLRLGLGYPEGPNALLSRTGLAHHHDVTQALFVALGDPDFAPARAAQVAKARELG